MRFDVVATSFKLVWRTCRNRQAPLVSDMLVRSIKSWLLHQNVTFIRDRNFLSWLRDNIYQVENIFSLKSDLKMRSFLKLVTIEKIVSDIRSYYSDWELHLCSNIGMLIAVSSQKAELSTSSLAICYCCYRDLNVGFREHFINYLT